MHKQTQRMHGYMTNLLASPLTNPYMQLTTTPFMQTNSPFSRPVLLQPSTCVPYHTTLPPRAAPRCHAAISISPDSRYLTAVWHLAFSTHLH